MSSVLESLQQSFRLADVADIALVALFLYAFFLWLKSTNFRQILIGMCVLAAVYALARTFNLYMTAAMFQAVLAFGAIAAIVVFQEDLRRSFARLALLGRIPRGRAQTADAILDTLVEVAFDFAKRKTGAIIAIRGTESLERHIRGSVALDARISRALLDSIFDPHSLGHDGAVVIESDRISQFAAHLPLSENIRELGSRGTRHSAALGLSEVSDALVLVVSEERGEVSVAEAGKLKKVDSPMELKRRLERLARHAQPAGAREIRRRLFVENVGLKLAALAVACVAWVSTNLQSETVQKTFVVSIEYRNLPETLDIDDSAPTEARLTLTGYERAFNLLVPSTLKVSLDLSQVVEGRQEIAIDESHVKLPSNLSLFRCVPRIVSFGVHTWVKTRLSVDLRTAGRLPREWRHREVQVVPNEVPVFIWRSRKSSISTIATEPLDISRLTDTSELKARFVLPEYLRIDAGQATEVTVKLDNANGKHNGTKPPQSGDE